MFDLGACLCITAVPQTALILIVYVGETERENARAVCLFSKA